MDEVNKPKPTSPYAAPGVSPIWAPASDSYSRYQIITAIEEASGVFWEDMVSGGRKKGVMRVRNAAYFYLYQYAGYSSKKVAKILKRKDHTSVLHGKKAFLNDVERDSNKARDLAARIVACLNSIPPQKTNSPLDDNND